MWRITTADMNKLDAFHRKCMRKIQRVFWPNQISNEELYRRSNTLPLSVKIRIQRWRWIGHVLRRGGNRDFKLRERGRRRGRQKVREKPKSQLRMTGGKHVDVLRSGPTWVEHISRCLKTWVLAFVSSAVSMLNKPVMLISNNFNCLFLLLCDIFHFNDVFFFKETSRMLKRTQAGRRTCQYRQKCFRKLM